MAMLLTGLEILNMNLSPERTADAQLVILTLQEQTASEPLSKELALAIKRLWADKLVQEGFGRRSEFQLNDSAPYFFEAIDRICSDDYVPTVQDILMTKVETTGVQEIQYTYKTIHFRIFDVGGQKSERRKWIHCFDNVNAILFIVAISEYDQTLREDGKTNRMIDSLALFSDIVNSEFFKVAQGLFVTSPRASESIGDCVAREQQSYAVAGAYKTAQPSCPSRCTEGLFGRLILLAVRGLPMINSFPQKVLLTLSGNQRDAWIKLAANAVFEEFMWHPLSELANLPHLMQSSRDCRLTTPKLSARSSSGCDVCWSNNASKAPVFDLHDVPERSGIYLGLKYLY
uniref:G-protein alpha subunit n=1 Tax=Heterorhabditis bacteriophora TaxID=37862 RepID=A0A1I7XFB6_HETBA